MMVLHRCLLKSGFPMGRHQEAPRNALPRYHSRRVLGFRLFAPTRVSPVDVWLAPRSGCLPAPQNVLQEHALRLGFLNNIIFRATARSIVKS